MDIALTLVAIALAIVLILRFKVDPVISLIISSVFLGLSAGVGAADTLSLIHISEPTRRLRGSRMPSSA